MRRAARGRPAAAERRAHGERERRPAAARDRGVDRALPADRGDPERARGAGDGRAARVAPARSPAGYAAVDAVVLDDVPARLARRRARSQRSATAVRDGGLGLLTLGGRHAYSLGGYAHSALDRVLPVASLSPGDLQRRHLAVELVLDRSGSMADTAGAAHAQDRDGARARRARRRRSSRRIDDELGIVAFDIAPHRCWPMQRVTPGAATTRVLVAHRRAARPTAAPTSTSGSRRASIRCSRASRRTATSSCSPTASASRTTTRALLRQLKPNHIAVATVGARDRRRRAAAARHLPGDGRQRLRDDARARPAQDLRQGDAAQRGAGPDQRPAGRAAAGQQPGRALAGGRASCRRSTGNVVTRLRVGRAGRPDRAQRQRQDRARARAVGLRHRARRLVDAGARARRGRRRGRRRRALWNDAVRWVARAVPPAPASAAASEGTSTALSGRPRGRGADARDPAQRACSSARTARARGSCSHENAPSVYSADIGVLPAGSYRLTLALPAALGGQRGCCGVDVPYAAEYLPTALGRSTLGQLAEQTGGSLLAPGDPGRAHGRPPLAGACRCSCLRCCSTWARSRRAC